MKTAAQRTSSAMALFVLQSNVQLLEIYYLLSALIHAFAFGIAVALHLGFGLSAWIVLAVFVVSNPLWAHAALGVWRWRAGKNMHR